MIFCINTFSVGCFVYSYQCLNKKRQGFSALAPQAEFARKVVLLM